MLGARRVLAPFEAEAIDAHSEAAKLDMHVRAPRQFGNSLRPLLEHLILLSGVGSDPKNPAVMVEHDRCLREGVRQVRQFRHLRME